MSCCKSSPLGDCFGQSKDDNLAVRRVKIASGQLKVDHDQDDDEATNSIIEESFRERALEEKCGVFGVLSNGAWPTKLDIPQIICLGLVGLQHRGQESAGIVTCKFKTEPFKIIRSEGLVSSAFNEFSMLSLKGNLGIGHTRYSTSGGSGDLTLAQPFVVHTKYGTIAVAHNGELVNSGKLRETLLSHGVGLSTGGDSELITQCLSQTPPEEFKHPRLRRKVSTNSADGSLGILDPANNETNESAQSQNGRRDASSSSSSSTKAKSNGGNNDKQRSLPRVFKSSSPIWTADLTPEEDNITSRLLYLMSLTPISYSLIVMYNECLYATRDCFGNRPLSIGMLTQLPGDKPGDPSLPFNVIDQCQVEGWCISSESCPFPSIHAELKRDVEPGEIIKFQRDQMPKTLAKMPRPPECESPSFCIFEYVYFARPDSIIERQAVYTVRKRCGERLAEESPAVTNDEDKKNFVVSPVPESSIPAALGYSHRSGIPYVEAFSKNRYVGRTFIQPSTRLRKLGVAKKFGPLSENFKGKSIILIDDSIVRGITIGQLVRLLRDAGAKEVHIRIASPPLHHPCYMGINIPTREELIANTLTPEQLALTLGAASVKYLSVEGLRESVQFGIKQKIEADRANKIKLPEVGNNDMGFKNRIHREPSNLAGHDDSSGNSNEFPTLEDEIRHKVGHCDACLTGRYPVPPE